MKKCVYLLFILLSSAGFAQFGYNPNVVNPVLEDDVMFRKIVIRKLNFNEKQNRGFAPAIDDYNFPYQLYLAMTGASDPKPIGLSITPYSTGMGILSLGRVSDEKKIKSSASDLAKIREEYRTNYDEANRRYGQEVDPSVLGCIVSITDPSGVTVNTLQPYGKENISTIEIIEEVVFDKRRSRMYINIIAFQLNAVCPDGEKPIAVAKYKEVDRYFRALYRESNQRLGRWYNSKNERRHMCIMDAFELRLFSSRIKQISNPENKELSELVNNNIVEELYKAQEAEMELMEFEHNLWEF
ncbi:MAG: gliding motility protein GldN [Raineya sp.]|nr:gliding motility protein GldN [Raineya sp.]